MNLYRLDVQVPAEHGGGSYPVSDILGPRLIRSHAAAREAGRMAAACSGWPVTLTRISGAGAMRAMATINPEGA